MQTGTIESISKTSVVVTVGDKTVSLTGKPVELTVSNLKLGDHVRFEADDKNVTSFFAKGKPAAATPQAAKRTSSSSPTVKLSVADTLPGSYMNQPKAEPLAFEKESW